MKMEKLRHREAQSGVVFRKEMEKCKCSELELRCRKAEEKCAYLELEISKSKMEYESLKCQMKKLELEKSEMEEELKTLMGKASFVKDGNRVCFEAEKQGGTVNLVGENEAEDGVFQLIVENNVLECEKKRAEVEVELWKDKFKELEMKIMKLEESSVLKNATPVNGTPYNRTVSFERREKFGLESDFKYGSRVRKRLNFEEESPNKKMAPSTPGGSRPAFHGIIDIVDSDDEPIVTKLADSDNQKKSEIRTREENNSKVMRCDRKNVEDTEVSEDDFTFNPTPKRKQASNIVTSGTESDSEDYVPICKLRRNHFQEANHTPSLKSNEDAAASATPARRRLVPLRKCFKKGCGETNSSNLVIERKNRENQAAEDGLEDVGSELESEGESLGGFIVDSSDSCDIGSGSQSKDESNCSVEYEEIISKIGRRRKEPKWEYEAEMLAAFGKSPELCMKAVCALYRQQTSEEKVSKETLFSNKRGFSKFDAIKGTKLAEFLIDGDTESNLKKSVEELRRYDSTGVDLCRKLATHYSKQLFEIYKNKEDPFFLPA